MFVGDMLVDKIVDTVMVAFGSFVADSVGSKVWVQWLQHVDKLGALNGVLLEPPYQSRAHSSLK
ncbi:hypothetical protein A2U01_0083532, partial [Trifolium medium]|nr:hypothetical protein [Trifolium medium]